MSGLSAVIPSKTDGNVWECVRAVRMNDPSVRIIVVDDGINWNELPKGETSTWTIIPGEKPFVFSRNVNLGIRAAGEDDLIVLNDDALLQTPGGFTAMQRMAQRHPEFGIISAACNNVGNRNQWPRPYGDPNDPAYKDMKYNGWLREEPRMVCFVSVLIPRRTIDLVGLMDEDFGGVDDRGQEIYGFCDDSYCWRVRRAGLKIGIFDGAFVDHASLISTFRADKPRSLDPGQRLFIKKYGVDNHGKTKEYSQWRHLFE